VVPRFAANFQAGFGVHPAFYKMNTLLLSQGVNGGDVALTTHPPLAPRLKKEYYFCAFMAYYRINFTFYILGIKIKFKLISKEAV
jgi:hypothetical protein